MSVNKDEFLKVIVPEFVIPGIVLIAGIALGIYIEAQRIQVCQQLLHISAWKCFWLF